MNNTNDVKSPANSNNKGLNIGLWIVQALLAIAFGMAGVMKTFSPIETLAQSLPWVSAELELLVRFIGVSELMGAIGLILPAALRIKPALTAWAGVGLATVMVLATGFHMMRGEMPAVPASVILGGMAAFAAWGRFKKAPIAPRGKN